ncbi:hypothetical protein KCU95_g8070, partial [Aureobasidium melanogenum]
MAEAAGLVLGAIPLVFLALDKYQECLEAAHCYARYEDTLLSIRDEVFIQQKLFYDTMETMGLYEPNYAQLEQCLQSHFPDNHKQFMRCIKRMADTINRLMTKLEIDASSKQAGDISSRVGWEWRRVKRSLSTKERRKMFDELEHLNYNLRALLSRPELPSKDWTPRVQTFVARYNQNDCDAWRRAEVKVDATVTSSSSARNDEQVLGPTIRDIQLLSVVPPQSTSTGQQSRSLFQWRPRSRSTSPLPPSPSSPAPAASLVNSAKKIDSLCRFVQGLDNGGEPLGFLAVPGGTKRVHVSTFPGAHKEEATLVHLLPPSNPPDHLKLSRRKRFEIAAAAAWATLLLCDTPWLDHTWDKHGLCFFSENAAGLPLSKRCVSMIQGSALGPNLTIAGNSKRLVRNEATFSLGVLLIELCLDQSFEDCKRAANIGTTATNIVDDYDFAQSLIENVFRQGGNSYGDAVQRCIEFAFPGRPATRNFSDAAFREQFHHLVVAPIEAALSTCEPD